MDRSEFTRIEEEIDRQGQTDEAKTGRLVAVARGNDPGDATPTEAEDALVRAYLGKALAVIDRFSAAQPYGVGFDEAKALDKAVAAVKRAVAAYDPAKGTFDAWCRVVVWRAVNKNVRRATADAPVFVSMRARELGGGEPGRASPETIADARAEAAIDRVEARVAVEEWRCDGRRAPPARRLPRRGRGRCRRV